MREATRPSLLLPVLMVAALAGFLFAAVLTQEDTAAAFPGGIAGYSGSPATNGGATCAQCHSGGTQPTVDITGPATLETGQIGTFTLQITGAQSGGSQPRGGLDVAADGGALAATGAGTQLSNGEVIHNSPQPFGGAGSVSWNFQWTAPATPGTYTIFGAGLSADGAGTGGDGVGSATLAVTVNAPAGQNEPPVSAPGGPYTGTAGQLVSFDGTASSDADGTITAYDWTFLDGSYNLIGSASGATTSFTFAVDGTYIVNLTVTDDQGATGSRATTATIGTVANQPPVADAGGPYSGTAGNAIGFDGSGSSDPEFGTLTYAWNFGDGTTGTGVQPSHAYSSAGSYTATLTVTDPASNTDTATATVTVNAPDGGAIYAASCASCHGAAGQGTGSGPSLQISTLSLAQINAKLTTGTMGPFASHLSSPQVDALSSFVKGLQSPTATTTTTTIPGADGKTLYNNKCASCHGSAGQGGAGPSLQASTLSVSQINSVLTTGSMSSFTAGLSGGQISAIATYAHTFQTPGATTSSTTTTTLPPTASGSQVYGAECASCHGAGGGGGFGPNLKASTMSLGQVTAIVKNGAAGMPAYGSKLSSGQISAVASYTKGLQDSSVTTTTTTLPVDAGASELYAAKCAGCHGPNGEGGVGPSLQVGDPAVAPSLNEITSAIRNGVGSMPGFAGDLTDEQITSLAAFSLSLQDASVGVTTSPTGGADIYEAWCAACHGDHGIGGIGPALVGTALPEDELDRITRQGQGAMPGFTGQLSDSDIEALVAYMVNLSSVGTNTATLADAQTGPELYALACASCHGVGGKGGIGSAVAGTQLDTQQLIDVIADGVEGMPAFRASLTSRQVGVLAEFVQSLVGEGEQPSDDGSSPGSTLVASIGDTNPSGGGTPSPFTLLVIVFAVFFIVVGALNARRFKFARDRVGGERKR